MARRRTRKKTRRSRPKTINAARVLESALIANAVTQGFFNTTIGEFAFEKGAMGMSQITARELFSGLSGGSFGTTTAVKQLGGKVAIAGNSFGDTVKNNLTQNGGQMVASLILIPAGFKVFSKLTTKPRSMANRALKMSGLPVRV
jgi:TRAP-type C4-dicarboxylate transport system permease large subunit